MKEKIMVKRKCFGLTKNNKEIQSFILDFILVLMIAVNPEMNMFFLRIVSFLAIAELSR